MIASRFILHLCNLPPAPSRSRRTNTQQQPGRKLHPAIRRYRCVWRRELRHSAQRPCRVQHRAQRTLRRSAQRPRRVQHRGQRRVRAAGQRHRRLPTLTLAAAPRGDDPAGNRSGVSFKGATASEPADVDQDEAPVPGLMRSRTTGWRGQDPAARQGPAAVRRATRAQARRRRPASRGACGIVDSAHRREPASTRIPGRYAFASGGHHPKYSRASSSIAAGNGSASSPAATRSAPTQSAATFSPDGARIVTASVDAPAPVWTAGPQAPRRAPHASPRRRGGVVQSRRYAHRLESSCAVRCGPRAQRHGLRGGIQPRRRTHRHRQLGPHRAGLGSRAR